MSDAIEKRRDRDEKPKKLFSVVVNIYDDGVLSGCGIEYRNLGRMKMQKLVIPDGQDFLSSVRSIIPSAIDKIETLVNAVYKDHDIEDAEESEKIGKVTVDIYSDGYVDGDFCELVKGSRGAPKSWRLPPQDFVSMVESRAGSLGETFKPLLNA